LTHQTVITPKSYGKSIRPSDLPTGIARFFPISGSSGSAGDSPLAVDSENFAQRGGVGSKLLVPVLEGVLAGVSGLMEAVGKTEMRLVGVSALIVWEGEERTLEAALTAASSPDMDSESESGSEEETAGGPRKIGPPFTVRMIDFAHVYAVPGQGPDEGVLKGLQTVIKLLEGRIEQVKAEL